MQKQKLILIIGVVLGVIAVFLIKVYLDQQRAYIAELEKKKAQKLQQQSAVPVLVAKKDITKDSPIEADSVELQNVPKEFMQPQAVTSLSRVTGMTTLAPIAKGEQITLSKLVWPTKASSGASGTLAMVTPVGKRAITILVDNIASLAGMIKAGDYVDVIALMPVPVQTTEKKQTVQAAVMPLFQNVLVLAVGREIGRPSTSSSSLPEVGRYSKAAEDKGGKPEGSGNAPQLITLALGPQETNLIMFVQEQGKIRLTLRSPADSQVQPAAPTTWDTLFQYVMPNREAAVNNTDAKDKEPKEVVEYVEIYRGLSKEKIPLSK